MAEVFNFNELPDPGDYTDWREWARAHHQAVTENLQELARLSSRFDRALPKRWIVTNGTLDRTYDADATTTAELADIIFTLISDLADRGITRTRGAA